MSRSLFTANWALLLGIVLAGIFLVYIACFAPCTYFGWMSVTEVPSRCLEGRLR